MNSMKQGAVVLMIAFVVLFASCVESGKRCESRDPAIGNGVPKPGREWPRFARPRAIVRVPMVSDQAARTMLATASGLAAQSATEGRYDDAVYAWEAIQSSNYEWWFGAMIRQTGARVMELADPWDYVDILIAGGIVKGYALYDYDRSDRQYYEPGSGMDVSVNVATTMCGILGGIAIDASLEEKAKGRGLKLLADCRGKTESWCFDQHRQHLNRTLLVCQDPKNPQVRDLAVAARALTVSAADDTYEKALEWMEPDSPVIGWGMRIEDLMTGPSSEYGHYQTASNWCMNMACLSTESPAETVSWSRIRRREDNRAQLADLVWEDGVSYVSFVMSDGDNVQWLMGNFAGGGEGHYYYDSDARGRFPMAWTLPPMDLAQCCPYALEHLFASATGNDDFIFFGGGYFYPDWFGRKRTERGLAARHVALVSDYMKGCGMNLIAVNAMDWDSPEAVEFYGKAARGIDRLLGVMTIQYNPYTAGNGQVLWVRDAAGRDAPVVSCKWAIWNNVRRDRQASPAAVAAMMNGMPTTGETNSPDRFGWAIVHCWSYFRGTGDNPDPAAEEMPQADAPKNGGQRGAAPAYWCARRLKPNIRAVTPEKMLLQIRLRLRTRQTLEIWLSAMRETAERIQRDVTDCPDAAALSQEIGSAIAALATLPEHGPADTASGGPHFESAKALSRRLDALRESLRARGAAIHRRGVFHFSADELDDGIAQ
ncbi:MAG TPA: GxGYxYP family putative glycoside hydrolase [Candidatus Brocadiia bacterium]|nr:GxGYxYP family putative glycoside hydrolase [Candidatus Brocadiia bacterium]